MAEAAAWAAGGAPHGALVVAEHQTAGRGRHGRTWTDAPGGSLMLSLVLRPHLRPDALGLVGLAAGLAVAEALDGFGVGAALKWPNDVRVSGRKVSGVLAEAAWTGPRPAVLLGVGLNVRSESVPADLEHRATSLSSEAGLLVGRLEPLRPLLDRLQVRLADAEDRPDVLISEVERRLEGTSSEVAVSFPGVEREPVRGRVLGLAPDGALRLDTSGGVVSVRAGEVTLKAGTEAGLASSAL